MYSTILGFILRENRKLGIISRQEQPVTIINKGAFQGPLNTNHTLD